MRSVNSISAAVQNALPVVAEKANATAQAEVAKVAAKGSVVKKSDSKRSAVKDSPANAAAPTKVDVKSTVAPAQVAKVEAKDIKAEAKVADKAVVAAQQAADKLVTELKRAKQHLSDSVEAPPASTAPVAPAPVLPVEQPGQVPAAAPSASTSAPVAAGTATPVATPATPAPVQPVAATAPAATNAVATSTVPSKDLQPAAAPRDPETRMQNLLDRFDRLASRLEKSLATRDDAAAGQGGRVQGFQIADRGLARLLVGRQLLEKSMSQQTSMAVQVADRLFALAAVIQHRNDNLDSLLNAVSPARSSGGYRNDYYAAREVAGLVLDLSA